MDGQGTQKSLDDSFRRLCGQMVCVPPRRCENTLSSVKRVYGSIHTDKKLQLALLKEGSRTICVRMYHLR